MQKVTVNLADNSYEIRVGSGILGQAGHWLKEKGVNGKAVTASKAVIVTDSNVKPLYAAPLQQSLEQAGFTVTVLEIPAGESQKTLEIAGVLYDRLAAAYADRNTLILALGGGVIGDLAGFVAATYMRGVPYIHVPTSLLAMVDSSIGGKTAVDRGNMKNIVGAFYQPRMVIADINALETLPAAELANGMAEVIKHGAIGDVKFFRYLEENMGKAMALDRNVLEKIVLQSAVQKARVVGRDEKESGERMILNYGHTIGHAVEAVSGYKLKHGQSIAIGMVLANRLAVHRGLLAEKEAVRIKDVINLAGLPQALPDFDIGEREKVLEVIKHDKKVLNNNIRFVFLKEIGRPVIVDDVSPESIREVIYGRIA